MFVEQADRPLIRTQPAELHPVIAALARAGRPLSNKELAEEIGCSPSYASRLRRQVEDQVYTYRRGRCVYTAHVQWRARLRWFPMRAEFGGLVIDTSAQDGALLQR